MYSPYRPKNRRTCSYLLFPPNLVALDTGKAPFFSWPAVASHRKVAWVGGLVFGLVLMGGALIWRIKSSDSTQFKETTGVSIRPDSSAYQPVVTENIATVLPETKNEIPAPRAETGESPKQAVVHEKADLSKAVVRNEQKALLEKQQQHQIEYDNLIDQGNGLINTANNKSGAMEHFSKARQLAETHELNIAKGNAAYTYYLEKGNRIYNNGSHEGAKAWYKLAQSVRSTEEVSRRIRDCEINL